MPGKVRTQSMSQLCKNGQFIWWRKAGKQFLLVLVIDFRPWNYHAFSLPGITVFHVYTALFSLKSTLHSSSSCVIFVTILWDNQGFHCCLHFADEKLRPRRSKSTAFNFFSSGTFWERMLSGTHSSHCNSCHIFIPFSPIVKYFMLHSLKRRVITICNSCGTMSLIHYWWINQFANLLLIVIFYVCLHMYQVISESI